MENGEYFFEYKQDDLFPYHSLKFNQKEKLVEYNFLENGKILKGKAQNER